MGPNSITAVLREAWATLPESSSRHLPATLAQSRNLAHASLETAICWRLGKFGWPILGLPFLPHTTMAVRSPPTRTKYPASPPPSRAFSLFSCQLAVGCQIKCLSLSLIPLFFPLRCLSPSQHYLSWPLQRRHRRRLTLSLSRRVTRTAAMTL